MILCVRSGCANRCQNDSLGSCWNGRRLGQLVGVRLVRLGLKNEEIAQLIGTSSETVMRTLTEVKKQRNIELSGSTLVLRNKPALEKLAADRDQLTHP